MEGATAERNKQNLGSKCRAREKKKAPRGDGYGAMIGTER